MVHEWQHQSPRGIAHAPMLNVLRTTLAAPVQPGTHEQQQATLLSMRLWKLYLWSPIGDRVRAWEQRGLRSLVTE